jgi:D-alanyl-D-alanine carboxypeptidase
MARTTALRLGQYVRSFLFLTALVLIAACSGPKESGAAPYAAYVMDARTGETLYSENADTRLHPASLTKMMTLYITFGEIERGNLSLDTMITVSANAAAQPPSRLGLKAGQKIQLRYLIRAAAVKSANDAAAAIGDYISGSPEKFGARMTRTAKSLGMNNTTFKNANGLTAKGHLSTAHDMSIMGRHLFYDFPQYYNIFSRRSTDAGIATVANTNRKFLDMYKGADGIKTGYTAPAGFNLTASAERDGVRIIATIFGGTSTPMRNAKMAELLDLGFKKAKKNVKAAPPVAPAVSADEELVASAAPVLDESDDELPEVEDGAGKTIRMVMAVETSPRPAARPGSVTQTAAATSAAMDDAVAAMANDIANQFAATSTEVAATPTEEAEATEIAAAQVATEAETLATQTDQPVEVAVAVEEPAEEMVLSVSAAPAAPQQIELVSSPIPPKHKAPIYDATTAVAEADQAPAATEVVTRISTSGGGGWGINVGRYNTRGEAERVLMRTLLTEDATLGTALRKIVERSGAYDADFVGLNQDQADLACRRLQSRGVQCFTMGP